MKYPNNWSETWSTKLGPPSAIDAWVMGLVIYNVHDDWTWHWNIKAFQTQRKDKNNHFFPLKNVQGGGRSLGTEIKLFKSNIPLLFALTHYFQSWIVSGYKFWEILLQNKSLLSLIKQLLYQETNQTWLLRSWWSLGVPQKDLQKDLHTIFTEK